MNDLTVVLVAGPRAADVIALAGAWCAGDLIGESIWVPSTEVARDRSGLARVAATRVGPTGLKHGELFELIGTRRINVLRVLGAQLLTHEGQPDLAQISDARSIAEQVRMAVPYAMGGRRGAGTKVLRVNLIIPESTVKGVGVDHVIPGWDVTAVVAAEDRSELERSNVYVRAESNFAAHAAAAIATVGGLWVGTSEGALDDAEPDSTSDDRDIVVIRSTVRRVVGDAPGERALKDAMKILTEDEAGPAPLLPWALPAADPLAQVKRATAYLLGRGDWRDCRPESPAAGTSGPEAEAAGSREGTAETPSGDAGENPQPAPEGADAATPAADAAPDAAPDAGPAARPDTPAQPGQGAEKAPAGGAVTHHQAMWFTVQMARSAKAVLKGEPWKAPLDAERDVAGKRMRPRTPDSMAELARRRIELNNETATDLVRRIEAEPVRTPNPATWRELRELCFSLVDGGPTPEGFAAPTSAGLRELIPGWAAVPDPADQPWPPEVSGSKVVRDPLTARRALRDLGDKVREQRADARNAGETRRARTRLPSTRFTPNDALMSLVDWLGRQRRSVTWRLAENVADRITELQGAAVGSQSTKATPPRTDDLERALVSLRVKWRAAGAIFVALGLLALVSGIVGTWMVPAWAIGLLALGVPLAVMHVAARSYLEASLRYLAELDRRLSVHRNAEAARAHARHERARLELLYAGLTDWSEILGRIIHRPWYPGGGSGPQVAEELVDSLPASVGVAVPVPRDRARARRLAAQAVPIVCTPGWNGASFDQLVEALEQVREGGDLVMADLDVHNGPFSARARLLEATRGRESVVHAAAPALAKVEEAVLEGALEMPATLVERLGRYSDHQSATDADYLGSALTGATPFSLELWTPRGLQRERHVPEWTMAWVPSFVPDRQRRELTVRQSEGPVSVRVDISRRAVPADLALFDRSGVAADVGRHTNATAEPDSAPRRRRGMRAAVAMAAENGGTYGNGNGASRPRSEDWV